jgi:hypothetical protein
MQSSSENLPILSKEKPVDTKKYTEKLQCIQQELNSRLQYRPICKHKPTTNFISTKTEFQAQMTFTA